MNFRPATVLDLPQLTALQHAAYAKNRAILGVEPIPLQADYNEMLATSEVWLAAAPSKAGDEIQGALILQPQPDHLLIWSIATDPSCQQQGLGRDLLAFAETRSRQLSLTTLRLYTGTRLAHLVAWYGRHGYRVERIEERPDRSITHMQKFLQ